MTNLSNTLQTALAAEAKSALTSIVADDPLITVEDLKGLISDNPNLGSLTLAELLGESSPSKASAPSSSPEPAQTQKASKKAPLKKIRSSSTEEERESFDHEVFEALKAQGGEDIPAVSLRGEVSSGDPAQIRNALNRLIERGLVTFTGRARGTRYSIASSSIRGRSQAAA